MSKTFSIIIPVHNRSDTLRRALESLRNQTDQDFEVIVCDDGSSEDIGSVVEDYKDLEIKFRRIPASGSPARPRNVAIGLATGEWISFLDSDDWWSSNRIARLKRSIDNADIVYHQLRVVHTDAAHARSKFQFVGRRFTPPLLTSMIAEGNPFATSATAIRRKIVADLGGMWEAKTGDAIDDFDLWLRVVAQRSPRVVFVAEALGYYEISNNNISAFSKKQYIRHRRLYRRQQIVLPKSHRSFARSHFEYALGSYALKLGMTRRALNHFSRIDPFVTPRKFVYAAVKYVLARRRLSSDKA